MEQPSLASQWDGFNRILIAPDSELKRILLEAMRLIEYQPQILFRIQADMDAAALAAKELRTADKRWYENMIAPLPGAQWEDWDTDQDPFLAVGRPRSMTPEMVLIFLILRGHWGSVTSKSAWERIVESNTLLMYLESVECRLPSRTAILTHLNSIQNETRRFIVQSQLSLVAFDGLDDFQELTIDSTTCGAHSCWPTDSKMLMTLLGQAYQISQSLKQFNIKNLNNGWIPFWLGRLDSMNYSILLTSGKANSKPKIKRYYRQFLRTGAQILDKLIRQLDQLYAAHTQSNFPPSQQQKLNGLVELLNERLYQACRVYEYTDRRIFNEVVLPAPKKVLSLSDPCAAFIKKGGREAVIGYKPQVGRSENGFITAFELQTGNPSDSTRLLPMVTQHIQQTGQTPFLVSTDDGYASAKGRKSVLELGVTDVSISGAKGRKITPPEDWNSEVLRSARSNRSAVESTIFVLKYKFDFGQLSRTGLENATAELLEKIITFNLWRAGYCRKAAKEAA